MVVVYLLAVYVYDCTILSRPLDYFETPFADRR